MTRHDPTKGGAGQGVGTPDQTTAALCADGDAERVAAELVERFGPAFAAHVSADLVALVTPLHRLHRGAVS